MTKRRSQGERLHSTQQQMKYSHRIGLLFIVFSALLTGCSTQYEKSYQFTSAFQEDQEGWVAGFADLPADYEEK